MLESNVVPFLRWAGGKRQLISTLLAQVPGNVDGKYIEPFLGAGSLFFALSPKSSILSDANPYLIDTYKQIRLNPETVRRELLRHIKLHSSAHYYKTRDEYNRGSLSAAQAARFIYLNKACFNGIFRVNTKGKFNVPKGSKDRLFAPTKGEFSDIAARLHHTTLFAEDFSVALKRVSKNDFVYLDPPYPAMNATAFFAHYTADRFNAGSQERLAEYVRRIDNAGTRFLMSNADDPVIRDLYKGFRIDQVPVTRYVNCRGVRIAVSELLIRNY